MSESALKPPVEGTAQIGVTRQVLMGCNPAWNLAYQRVDQDGSFHPTWAEGKSEVPA